MRGTVLFKDTIKDYLEHCDKKVYGCDSADKAERRKDFFRELLSEATDVYDIKFVDGQEDEITATAELLIKAETRNKMELAEFYSDYVDFVNDKSVYKDAIIRLKRVKNVYSTIERQLDIIKNCRTSLDMTQERLAKKYHVSRQVIANDLNTIQDGGLVIFNQVFDLDARKSVYDVKSTVVPIVLAQNITEVVTMLNGLGIMAENEMYKAYAEKTAFAIWGQLSDSVQKHIQENLIDKLSLDRRWYNHVAENAEYGSRKFNCERDYTEVSNRVMMMYKCSANCIIRMKEPDGRRFENARIEGILFDTDEVKLNVDDKHIVVKRSDIEFIAQM